MVKALPSEWTIIVDYESQQDDTPDGLIYVRWERIGSGGSTGLQNQLVYASR